MSRESIYKKGDLFGSFRLEERIGKGGFGEVWKVVSTEDGRLGAMKVEPTDAKRNTLKFEGSVLRKIGKNNCFPEFLFEGTDGISNFLVEELLGPSLSRVAQNLPDSHFHNQFAPQLFKAILEPLEALHEFGYIHRDIKPQNFLVRPIGARPICLIDFGISKIYRAPDGSHLEPRNLTVSLGSFAYASPHFHERIELSRRDDLFSLVYTLLALLGIKLPWTVNTQMSPDDFLRMKQEFPIDRLVEPLGTQFVDIARHILQLGYADTPDYAFIYSKLDSMPKPTVPYEWMNQTAEQGNNDPTGLIHHLAPYLNSEEKKCIVC